VFEPPHALTFTWDGDTLRLERGLSDDSTRALGTERTGEWEAHYEEYQRRGLPAAAPLPS